MTQADRIITAFGSIAATARALGIPYTTVQGWAQRGRIPQWRWPELMAAAKAEGVALTHADFLPDLRETA